MALKDLLQPQPKVRNSWIELMKSELSDEDYDALIAAIDNKALSGSFIARQMTSYGHTVSATTINDIRNKRNA